MNETQRAFEATQILDNELFKERMQHLQDEALAHLADANLVDIEELRARVAYFQAANRFQKDLRAIAAIGEMPQEEHVEEVEKPHWAARLLRRNVYLS
jgi:uncharacterized secreted protein with C-terminal beta-propeller domain